MEHRIVSREEWLKERVALLEQEKAHTRERDRLAAARRALPWVRIDKAYWFDAPEGRLSLADLFDGRSQLIVKHFMLGPGQRHYCVGCSFQSDHAAGALVHLQNHDVSYVTVARAPLAEIEPFRRRMGWPFRWVSSHGSDFNYDFNVSFRPEQLEGEVVYNYRPVRVGIEDLSGNSVFYRNAAGEVFHTYSTFGRGSEEQLGTYAFLDLTPKGRDETRSGNLTDWVRLHDSYGDQGSVRPNGQYVPAADSRPDCCN